MVFYIKKIAKFFLAILPLSLKIALNFQKGWKKEKITSFISNVLIIGITLNIIVSILSISIINGFENALKNKILNIVPHLEISFLNKFSIKNWKFLKTQILNVPDVIAISPYLNFIGLISNKTELHVLYIHAIDTQYETKFQKNVKYFYKDQSNILLQLDKIHNSIIIGSGIAKKFNLKIGDKLSIFPANINKKNNFVFPQLLNFKIVNIIKFNSQLDHKFAIISLFNAQNILNRTNQIDGVNIKVKNMFKLHDVIKQFILINNPNFFQINTWMLKYGYIYQDIQTVRAIIYLCVFLVCIIFSSSIISMLTAIMKRKIFDVAILFSLGAKNRLIYSIFLWYGGIYIIFGSFWGILIGLFVSHYFNVIIKKIENLLNIQFLSSNIYFVDSIPIQVVAIDIFLIILFIFILFIISSIYSIFKMMRKNSTKFILS